MKKWFLENFTEYTIFKLIVVMFLVVHTFGRGINFIGITDTEITDSQFYTGINFLINTQTLGVMLIIASALLFASLFSENRLSVLMFTVGNLFAFVFYITLSLSGVEFAIRWWTGYQNLVFANTHLFLVVWGCLSLWIKTKMKDM